MKYIVENNIVDFKFWGGAKDNAALLTYDELASLDDDIYELLGCEDIPTETEVNDLFWFDFNTVCEHLGLEYDDQTGSVRRQSDEDDE